MTYHTLPSLSPFRKAVAACVGAVIASIPLLWDQSLSQSDTITLITVWATAFGVFQVANQP